MPLVFGVRMKKKFVAIVLCRETSIEVPKQPVPPREEQDIALINAISLHGFLHPDSFEPIGAQPPFLVDVLDLDDGNRPPGVRLEPAAELVARPEHGDILEQLSHGRNDHPSP